MNSSIINIQTTIISAIVTFAIILIIKDRISRHPVTVGKYRIHHSVTGVALFIIGLFYKDPTISSIGLGIYISHIIEEIIFKKNTVMHSVYVSFTTKKK